MWVVVEVMVSFWVLNIMRHLVFRGPKKGTIILTTAHVYQSYESWNKGGIGRILYCRGYTHVRRSVYVCIYVCVHAPVHIYANIYVYVSMCRSVRMSTRVLISNVNVFIASG